MPIVNNHLPFASVDETLNKADLVLAFVGNKAYVVSDKKYPLPDTHNSEVDPLAVMQRVLAQVQR
jgi:hypothetical protein